MLVQCEYYEVDGQVLCDVICEHCGEVAIELALRSEVVKLVMGNEPALCDDCVASKCKKCGRFPTPNERTDGWYRGVCWDCTSGWLDRLREKAWTDVATE